MVFIPVVPLPQTVTDRSAGFLGIPEEHSEHGIFGPTFLESENEIVPERSRSITEVVQENAESTELTELVQENQALFQSIQFCFS